jgi:hypothetical protein
MSQQITWNFRVIREFLLYSADFQQISTLEPNLAMKFVKFSGEIFIIKSITHNVSKKIFFIKIHPRKLEKSSIEDQKRVKSNEIHTASFNVIIFSWFHRFFVIQLKISPVSVDRFRWKISFWKRYELYFLW